MKNKNLPKNTLIIMATVLLVCLASFTTNAQVLGKNEIKGCFEKEFTVNYNNLILVDDEPGYDNENNNPPEDYTSIQEAIDASSNNDLIFVFEGTYSENIIINNKIFLIGENKEKTIIKGNGIGDVVQIVEDYVVLTGFTIKNSGDWDPDNHQAGIEITSNYNIIKGNKICDNKGNGVFINSSSYNNIVRNIISNNHHGVLFEYATNNTVSNNQIINNEFATCLYYSNDNTVIINDFSNNNYAICINNATLNNISSNIISNNEYGIYLYYSSGNTISGNNFIDNKKRNALFRGYCKNNWDGNYWNRPRLLPKPIFGRMGKLGLICWVDFDLKPARGLYTIQP